MFLEPYIGGKADKRYVSSPVAKALVLDWKSWLAQLFLDVFLGLSLTGPKKASKSTILYNRLNKEKNSCEPKATTNGCEPKATTNIAFAQGSQTSNSTS